MNPGSTVAEVETSPRTRTAKQAGVLSLVLLSLGHCFVDLYSGAMGALQPVFVERLGLTLTQAGIVGGVFVVVSSVTQPAFGVLSDRYRTRLFAALGPGITGIAISALGLAPSYAWLLVLVMLGGVGIAIFHPPASAAAAFSMSARRRSGWMAIFISSGTLGLSFGPTYFSALIEWLGLPNIYWAAIPGVLVSAFLLVYLPPPGGRVAPKGSGIDWPALRGVWKPLLILYTLVFIRSIVQVVFNQFLPLYLRLERGYELDIAAYSLTFFMAAGALGGFLGGHLADRFGGKAVIVVSMIGSVPFLLAFFFTGGFFSLACLALGGFILLFTIPVNVVMAQELVPSQAGTVSALTMGFAWGTAGMIFIPLVGWASDLLSMHQVMMALVFFPVAGFFLALKLKK